MSRVPVVTLRQPRDRHECDVLLLVSYHFPPSEAVGALRWEQLAWMAWDRGYALDVVTGLPDPLPSSADVRLANLPPSCRVVGVPMTRRFLENAEGLVAAAIARVKESRARVAPAPISPLPGARSSPMPSLARSELRFRIGNLRDWIRTYYAIDSQASELSWARAAAHAATDLVSSQTKLLVTCGPPHPVHFAARRVARRHSLPLVLDLRDPWSLVERFIESHASPAWPMLAGMMERLAVRSASAVIMNTDRARSAMQARYPQHAAKMKTVMNGFDADARAPVDDGVFRVAFAGTIYLDRDPGTVLAAFARAVAHLNAGPDRIRLEFMGDIQGDPSLSIQAQATALGIGPYISVHPRGPRSQALDFLARSVLLVSLAQDSHMAIPSKVFEYMQFEAWLVALAEPDSATADVLANTEADVVAPHDVDRLTQVIIDRFLTYTRQGRPRPCAPAHLSRAAQGAALFDTLEGLIRPDDSTVK